ncbi:MAG: hypothetical protein ACJ76J_02570 [Thermoanaerobaculia bacterium]
MGRGTPGDSARKSPARLREPRQRTVRAVLFDIASDAASCQDFHEEVQRFFDDTNTAALRNWQEAVYWVGSNRT